MADCKCGPLLLYRCPGAPTLAPSPFQGSSFTFTRYTLKWIQDDQFWHLFVWFQIAPVENDDSYDELKRDAKTCLSLMSQGLLYSEQIPMVLNALQEVEP